MNAQLAAHLLRRFTTASLDDKVLIACAIHYAKYRNEDVLRACVDAWVKAVKLQIDLEEIVKLYREGLADYTGHIKDYSDVAKFVALVLAEALR